MRISRLSALAVMATLALAPAANAMPQDLRSPDARDAAAHPRGFAWQGVRVHARQDLRSPDARDADAARHAQTLQDLARLHAGNPRVAGTIAQEKYYSSYGDAQPAKRAAAPADDSPPWPAIGIGLALIVLVAGAVIVAVRTRRRVRLAV